MLKESLQTNYTIHPSVEELYQPGLTGEQNALFDQQLEVPSLAEQGIVFHDPSEGVLRYAKNLRQTVEQWQQDPQGEKRLKYLEDALGIDDIRAVFREAGAEAYLDLLTRGSFTTLISTQVYRPTPYFLLNVYAAREVNRRIDPSRRDTEAIPTAVVLLDYFGDTFTGINADKHAALGKQKALVNTHYENGVEKEEFVTFELQPYARREKDGTLRRIKSMDEANGYPCSDILIQVTDAADPTNFHFVEQELITDETGKVIEKRITTHYEAALGFRLSDPYDPSKSKLVNVRRFDENGNEIMEGPIEESISLTDFWRTYFYQSIDAMRAKGQLPSEEEMPLVWIDMQKLYTTIGKYARLPEKTRSLLLFNAEASVQLDQIFRLHADDTEALQLLNQAKKEGIDLGVDIGELMKAVLNKDIARRFGPDAKNKKRQGQQEIESDIPQEKKPILISAADVIAHVKKKAPDVQGSSYEEVLQYVLDTKDLHYDEQSGLLVHGNGMLNHISYYMISLALTSAYCECSGCTGPDAFFTNGVARSEHLMNAHGIPTSEIRTPDREIALEDILAAPPQFAHSGKLQEESRAAKQPFLERDPLIQRQHNEITSRLKQARRTSAQIKNKPPEALEAVTALQEELAEIDLQLKEIRQAISRINDSTKRTILDHARRHLEGEIQEDEEDLYQTPLGIPMRASTAALLAHMISSLPDIIVLPNGVEPVKKSEHDTLRKEHEDTEGTVVFTVPIYTD